MDNKIEERVLYKTWHNMISRCYNVENGSYRSYGSKGVNVCQEWIDSFEQFKIDVGFRPDCNHSLDRINPYGDYEPKNCRWSDREVQAANKRKKYGGYLGEENNVQRLPIWREFCERKNKKNKVKSELVLVGFVIKESQKQTIERLFDSFPDFIREVFDDYLQNLENKDKLTKIKTEKFVGTGVLLKKENKEKIDSFLKDSNYGFSEFMRMIIDDYLQQKGNV